MQSDLIATQARKQRANCFKNNKDIHLYVLVIYTVQFVGSPRNKQDKIEIRAYIKDRVALSIPAKQIYNELNDIYGSSTVSYMTLR